MKKRLICICLVLMVLNGLVLQAGAASVFTDVKPGSWYEESVNFVYEQGLMKGTGGTSFEPQTTMSRAMLVTVLYRIAGEPQVGYGHPFVDLRPGAWYEEAVSWAYANGVVNGVTNTTFCPNNAVTREQMVTIFCRYAASEGLDVTASADIGGYADRMDIDKYAVESFRWAVANGIVNGTDATHLSPNDNATRAVCATIIRRFVQWSQEKNPDDTRPCYDLGNSRELSGTPFALVIYLDDNESSWNQTDVGTFWKELLIPGLDYIEGKAAQWNTALDFQTAYYVTDPAQGLRIHYNGVIVSDIMKENPSGDILDQVAVSIGYGTKEEMHKGLQTFSGEEEILYLIVLNKDGRSYTIRDESDDGSEMMEYCILFPDFPDYQYETPAATVAHEILHLYGAEDYYNPFGDTPGRAELAAQICPTDIMLTVYTDISYNEVGNFTAYTVGWTDVLDPEYLDPRWWQ